MSKVDRRGEKIASSKPRPTFRSTASVFNGATRKKRGDIKKGEKISGLRDGKTSGAKKNGENRPETRFCPSVRTENLIR